MLFKKSGLPEEGELVLCTVTNVQHHSVFVRMEEYGISGMIHISEISPGRIRNIRDFVKEGKVIVTKVLRVNPERGHVDLSLRRVSDNQRKIKVNEIKQEQKAEKILELIASSLKKEVRSVYDSVSHPVFEHYPTLFSAFMAVVEGTADLAKLGVPADVAKPLSDLIRQRLKLHEVSVNANLSLHSYAPEGVDRVRAALRELEQSGTAVHYLAAGKYRLTVKAPNYKQAEKLLEQMTTPVMESFRGQGGEAELVRTA